MADPAHIADHVRGAKRPCGTPFTAPYSRELLFCIALCSMQCANYGYPTPTLALRTRLLEGETGMVANGNDWGEFLSGDAMDQGGPVLSE
jgi:hypothetical protein